VRVVRLPKFPTSPPFRFQAFAFNRSRCVLLPPPHPPSPPPPPPPFPLPGGRSETKLAALKTELEALDPQAKVSIVVVVVGVVVVGDSSSSSSSSSK